MIFEIVLFFAILIILVVCRNAIRKLIEKRYQACKSVNPGLFWSFEDSVKELKQELKVK